MQIDALTMRLFHPIEESTPPIASRVIINETASRSTATVSIEGIRSGVVYPAI